MRRTAVILIYIWMRWCTALLRVARWLLSTAWECSPSNEHVATGSTALARNLLTPILAQRSTLRRPPDKTVHHYTVWQLTCRRFAVHARVTSYRTAARRNCRHVALAVMLR